VQYFSTLSVVDVGRSVPRRRYHLTSAANPVGADDHTRVTGKLESRFLYRCVVLARICNEENLSRTIKNALLRTRTIDGSIVAIEERRIDFVLRRSCRGDLLTDTRRVRDRRRGSAWECDTRAPNMRGLIAARGKHKQISGAR